VESFEPGEARKRRPGRFPRPDSVKLDQYVRRKIGRAGGGEVEVTEAEVRSVGIDPAALHSLLAELKGAGLAPRQARKVLRVDGRKYVAYKALVDRRREDERAGGELPGA
jgi:hypothetical protein